MKGYALVIGIDNYETLPKLDNAVNDARAIGDALEKSGFIVKLALNLTIDNFHTEIDQFDKSLQGNDVGLFFFAGHGFQHEGTNYLAGTEFIYSTVSTYKMEKDGVKLDDVIKKMLKAKTDTRIIILDACRKPFAVDSRGSLDINLAPVFAPKGTLIAFSTSPWESAKDGVGKPHSYYTSAFLRHIQDTNISIEEFFKRVRTTLSITTSGEQTSWEHTSLIGEFKFNDGTLVHSRSLPYSESVILDHLFRAGHSGSAIDLALIDLGREWKEQKAAIIKLQQHGASGLSDDQLFLLGRGLTNGGENNEFTIMDILRDLGNWLVRFAGDRKEHILNGILYEIYFNSKGLIRRKGQKIRCLNEIFALEGDARFVTSFDLIGEQLRPFTDKLIYIPSSSPKSVAIDLGVKDHTIYPGMEGKLVSSINVHGKDISVPQTGKDWLGGNVTKYEEFVSLLSKELIIPKKRITINPTGLESFLLKIPFQFDTFRSTKNLFGEE